MEFSFLTARKIIFKTGAVRDIDEYVKEYGKHFLLVVDPAIVASPDMPVIMKKLDGARLRYTIYGEVTGEPTVEQVDEVCEIALREGCDAVISIGGGSNIDVGKAVAALMTNGTPALDYMEYVGKGKKVTKEPAPFISIPTTAGTGSEVTKNAVLGSKVLTFKRSMRSDMMIANCTIIDPAMTVGCPPGVTANSGIDAMTHLIEAYVTWRANPISDGLALKGIELAGKYLERAYENGSDIEAREGMSLAALLGGMAFANSGLGAAHGIGMAIGIAYHVPHGEACGILLPHVMRLNQKTAEKRMCMIGEALTGKHFEAEQEGAEAAVDFIYTLTEKIGIKPDFKHLNIPKDKIPDLAKASYGTSMSSNPVQLEMDEMISFITELV